MKTRPIILNADEVRAVLDGRKTQFRRAVKPQPVRLGECYDRAAGWLWPPGTEPGEDGAGWPIDGDATNVMADSCPFGVVGDRLWARETWRFWNGDGDVQYREDETYRDCGQIAIDAANEYSDRITTSVIAWRPSTQMPRWASRLTLEVTGVRVELDNDKWVWVVEFERVED